MENQKITNLLDNTPNKTSKFRTKNRVELNDESRETYNANSQTQFKTSMLRSILCHYSDAYIPVSATITFPPNTDAAAANLNNKTNMHGFLYATPFLGLRLGLDSKFILSRLKVA